MPKPIPALAWLRVAYDPESGHFLISSNGVTTSTASERELGRILKTLEYNKPQRKDFEPIGEPISVLVEDFLARGGAIKDCNKKPKQDKPKVDFANIDVNTMLDALGLGGSNDN